MVFDRLKPLVGTVLEYPGLKRGAALIHSEGVVVFSESRILRHRHIELEDVGVDGNPYRADNKIIFLIIEAVLEVEFHFLQKIKGSGHTAPLSIY